MRDVVVHVVTTLNVGGTERQLVELLRGLLPAWRAELACFRPVGGLLDEVRALGLEPVHLPLGGTLAHPTTVGAIGRLAKLALAREAALVHCHDLHAVLVGVPAARLAGVPVIASRRDLAHHVRPGLRPALRLALRGADRVLANAATVAAQAACADGVPPERIAIVPNGLDLPRFDARAAAPPDDPPPAPGGAPTVVTVARLTHPVKGHDDLLVAAARVRRALPAVRFLLVGDGPRRAELERAAAGLGVADVVTFLGRRRDVPALLARADLVCHPARAEGLPNAVIEAMAAGRPIVATAAGGVPELIRDGEHGRLVPVGDADALADAMLATLGDRARAAAMGRAARAHVERELTLERLVQRTDALYRAVAGLDAARPVSCG